MCLLAMQLRHIWLNELERRVQTLEGRSWTEWWFGFIKTGREAQRTQAELETAAKKPLMYIRLALILEQQMAHAMQDDFALSLIQPGVFGRAEELLQLVQQKVAAVKSSSGGFSSFQSQR